MPDNANAPDPSAPGGPGGLARDGGLDVRPARPRLTPTGTRQARLRRRLEASALKTAGEADEALRWLWIQVREAKSPKERRLCAATALQHVRQMAKSETDDGVARAANVLVIAPEDLRSLLASPRGADDLLDALRAHAAPAPAQGLPGAPEGRA